MAARIRYMGNKHALASHVAELVATETSKGPLIDLFCGMCSVGSAIACTGRAVWGNDIQAYAVLAARCHLSSRDEPLRSDEVARVLVDPFCANLRALSSRFGKALRIERDVLASASRTKYQSAYESWSHAGNDSKIALEAAQLAATPTDSPYRLCALTFAWGYFGLRQAIELDSLRYAIDARRADGGLTADQADWALLGLLEAASVCSSGPGHFAQYLRGVTDTSVGRICRQRNRVVWDLFLYAVAAQRPFGSAEWRSKNRVLHSDALEIWPHLDDLKVSNAVIYADPPYSKDHYSRYYHVLETLVRYDYPTASGAGRYRPNRFQTPFSLRTAVEEAFEKLFQAIASRGFTLVLSYPSNGLLSRVTAESLDSVLRREFDCVRVAFTAKVSHSTLGARHGHAQTDTKELIWIAS